MSDAGIKWRVRLGALRLRRLDGAEEDDFKTWALTTVVGASGPSAALWYPNPDGTPTALEPAANLGKTSVRYVIVWMCSVVCAGSEEARSRGEAPLPFLVSVLADVAPAAVLPLLSACADCIPRIYGAFGTVRGRMVAVYLCFLWCAQRRSRCL